MIYLVIFLFVVSLFVVKYVRPLRIMINGSTTKTRMLVMKMIMRYFPKTSIDVVCYEDPVKELINSFKDGEYDSFQNVLDTFLLSEFSTKTNIKLYHFLKELPNKDFIAKCIKSKDYKVIKNVIVKILETKIDKDILVKIFNNKVKESKAKIILCYDYPKDIKMNRGWKSIEVEDIDLEDSNSLLDLSAWVFKEVSVMKMFNVKKSV